MQKFVRIFYVLFAGVFAFSAHASAQNETGWQDHQGMISTRIIVASDEVGAAFPRVLGPGQDGVALLAWEATLTDGWKTYWRSPGEAGLPVRLFQDGQELDLFYPFPERFELFGLETFGYSDQVIIPFQVPLKEGVTTLSADFMVCKEICVPFETSYEITVGGADRGTIVTDTRVRNWLARVPERTGTAPAGLTIQSVRLTGMPGHQNLIVDASAAQPLTKADMLAELDEMTQFHTPSIRLLKDGRSARFVLPAMSGKKGRDLAGKRVRLTFSDGRGNAIDRFFQLPE